MLFVQLGLIYISFDDRSLYAAVCCSSFIILHTYKHDATDKLLWDIHFWLGSKTSQVWVVLQVEASTFIPPCSAFAPVIAHDHAIAQSIHA